MFIGHENIAAALQEYEYRISKSDNTSCLTGTASYRSAARPYTEHILYLFLSPEELDGAELLPNMNLLVLNPQREDLTDLLPKDLPLNVTEVFTEDVDRVRMLLRDHFDRILRDALMADTILDHLFHGESIQEMVDTFSKGLQNPVFVFNAGFYLIAASYDMANDHEKTKMIVENGHLTEKEFKLLNDPEMPYAFIKNREKPVRMHHRALGFDQLVCAIDTRKDMGHIVLCAINRPLTESDESMILMLKKGIYQQMIRQEFIRNNSGFPYEFFLKDLLDGKIISTPNPEQLMARIDMRFLDQIWCLVIETSRSSRYFNPLHIRNELETLVPGTKTLQYNGEIIALFQTEAGKDLPEAAKEKLAGMCESYDLYAGMSNCFNNIMQLAAFYRQALEAIELGTAGRSIPGLYCYDKYYLHHIIDAFSQKTDAGDFCSPKLRTLLEYDSQNGTELAYSLYMYLICERNSINASKAMFIHRNTLIYRLKKIDSLVDISYDDYHERHYIILSYEMLTGTSKPQ